MGKTHKEFGKHYLVEFINCDVEKLKFAGDVKNALLQAAKDSKAVILNYFFHQFEPEGVTGIILIAESHFSIHTWPQDCYAAFDVFTCGSMDAERAIETLKNSLGAREVKVNLVRRGT